MAGARFLIFVSILILFCKLYLVVVAVFCFVLVSRKLACSECCLGLKQMYGHHRLLCNTQTHNRTVQDSCCIFPRIISVCSRFLPETRPKTLAMAAFDCIVSCWLCALSGFEHLLCCLLVCPARHPFSHHEQTRTVSTSNYIFVQNFTSIKITYC